MMVGGRDMTYERRLKFVGLTTLETRRERADLLEVYKVLNGLEGVSDKDFLIRDNRKSRGHAFKLFKKRVRLDIAKYNFSNRICNGWNSLPFAIVDSPSVNAFKSGLDIG